MENKLNAQGKEKSKIDKNKKISIIIISVSAAIVLISIILIILIQLGVFYQPIASFLSNEFHGSNEATNVALIPNANMNIQPTNIMNGSNPFFIQNVGDNTVCDGYILNSNVFYSNQIQKGNIFQQFVPIPVSNFGSDCYIIFHILDTCVIASNNSYFANSNTPIGNEYVAEQIKLVMPYYFFSNLSLYNHFVESSLIYYSGINENYVVIIQPVPSSNNFYIRNKLNPELFLTRNNQIPNGIFGGIQFSSENSNYSQWNFVPWN